LDALYLASELLTLLLVFGAPAYAAAAIIQLTVLRRARVGWGRALLATAGAVTTAAPVTLVVWWLTGFLPPAAMPWLLWGEGHPVAGPFAYIGPPAVIASAGTFSLVTWLGLRRCRLDSSGPSIKGAA
jgi:hypothetical protein